MFLHSKNIYHCDLKPANILFEKDEYNRIVIKIADFGLTSQKLASLWRGTPGYMAPEMHMNNQQHGKEGYQSLDCFHEASDIWSMGVIGYQLLCKRKPYNQQRNNVYQFNENE